MLTRPHPGAAGHGEAERLTRLTRALTPTVPYQHVPPHERFQMPSEQLGQVSREVSLGSTGRYLVPRAAGRTWGVKRARCGYREVSDKRCLTPEMLASAPGGLIFRPSPSSFKARGARLRQPSLRRPRSWHVFRDNARNRSRRAQHGLDCSAGPTSL